jgi:magnesium transporter
MIIASHFEETLIQKEINANNYSFLKDALWIDLINPTSEEEALVEQCIGLNIPTREEMKEIELSSRLYKQNDTLVMTATMIAQAESSSPMSDAVTFVLTKTQLVTIRYIEPQAFILFISRLQKLEHIDNNPSTLLTELLDVTVDRLADILQIINHQLESYSTNLLQQNGSTNRNYQQLLQQLGINGALNSKMVESLVSFSRLIPFFDQSAVKIIDNHVRLTTLSKDINALNDHATFLSNKISFLLEATLGMVQIEQNSIIKIFSVAAVIFLPPTLIASIYGMNFQFMPELSWKFGYFLAVALMLFSSWLPYKYFKHRKWL